MKCPKCGKELKASLTEGLDKSEDYVEVEFACSEGHSYFTGVSEDDLIEDI